MRSALLSFIATVLGLIVLLQNKYSEGIDLNFYQNDYEIKFERAELFSFNKRYLNHFDITTFKFNRSHAAVNLSYAYRKTEIVLSKLTVTVQCYKFASNEYRLFPIRFQMNMCDIYSKDIAGMGNSKCRNFQGCPTEKGKEYYMCNFAPNASKFPPLIPNGRYMVELHATYNTIDLWNIHIYAEVTRPISKK